MNESTDRAALVIPATVEGWFYLVSGLWPVFNIRSFEAVTGPKVDRWLVKTVGLLLSVVGGVELAAARRQRVSPELAMLGAGVPLALLVIDLTYVSRRRISKVYLLDALAQLGLIGWWGAAIRRNRVRN
ncbi:MAG TPA: hypothetical protein VF660_11935 [Actinomycetota bacterium]|jgi:hypothetical protein